MHLNKNIGNKCKTIFVLTICLCLALWCGFIPPGAGPLRAGGPDDTALQTAGAAGDPPIVNTGSVDVWSGTATVYGRVTHNGLDTTWYFEYGKNTDMKKTSDSFTVQIQPGTPLMLEVYTELKNIENDTKYYYRIVAENAAGTTYGSTANFATNAIGTESCFIGTGSAGD